MGGSLYTKDLPLTSFSSKKKFLEIRILIKLRFVGRTFSRCLYTLFIGYSVSFFLNNLRSSCVFNHSFYQFLLIQLLVDPPGLLWCPSYFPRSALNPAASSAASPELQLFPLSLLELPWHLHFSLQSDTFPLWALQRPSTVTHPISISCDRSTLLARMQNKWQEGY